MGNIIDWIDEVRTSTYELNDTSLKDEDIVKFLNKGLKDALSLISRKLELLLYKVDEVDIVGGTYIYDIPNNCLANKIKMIQTEYQGNLETLIEKPLEEDTWLRNLNNSDPARYYILYANKIHIYPTPINNLTDGLKIHFIERLLKLDKPHGRVRNVIDGTKIYVDSLVTLDSDNNTILEVNDYITITNDSDGTTNYTFRVESLDTVNNYVTIFTGITGLTVSGVDTTNKYFTFSGSPDLSNIVPGDDTLTISGSTGNDGDYVIVAVDDDNDRVYVRDTISSAVVDGSGEVSLPSTKKGQTISTDARNITYDDFMCPFEATCKIRLPEIFEDYLVQYSVIKVFKQGKEPIQDEMVELQRIAQEIENMPSDRMSSQRFRIRDDDCE